MPLECSLNLFEISLINWSKSSIAIACLKYLCTEHVLTLQKCYCCFVMQGLILIYLIFVRVELTKILSTRGPFAASLANIIVDITERCVKKSFNLFLLLGSDCISTMKDFHNSATSAIVNISSFLRFSY